MDANSAFAARQERLKVAQGLAAFEGAKRYILRRQVDIRRGAFGNLQEQGIVCPTLMQLPGRVQEARSET